MKLEVYAEWLDLPPGTWHLLIAGCSVAYVSMFDRTNFVSNVIRGTRFESLDEAKKATVAAVCAERFPPNEVLVK